jgi:ABC-2 type transport system ATP-binding protein
VEVHAFREKIPSINEIFIQKVNETLYTEEPKGVK